MTFNIMLGIVLPWAVAIFMVRKPERYIVAVMSPFATTLGYTLNTLWTHQGFGYMLPKFPDNLTLAGLPCELGVFPVTVSLFIIMYRRTHKLILMLILFPLVNTSCEALGLILGKLVYLKGWNLFETYIEYVVGFAANLLYWQLVSRVRRHYQDV
jgi:hypothetical protein